MNKILNTAKTVGKQILDGSLEGFIFTVFLSGFIGAIYILTNVSLALAFLLIFLFTSYRVGIRKGNNKDDEPKPPGRSSYSR